MGKYSFGSGMPTFNGIPMLGSVSYSGNTYWVDDGDAKASNGNPGTADRPFATLDYAVGKCTANNGDVIYVKEGHTEVVTAAGGLDLDVAGITIIFLGNGTNRGSITFSTVVGADMDVDAANITMINPRFIAGIDALTGPIDVNAANFQMFDATWEDGTTINTTDCLVADANADELLVDGFTFIDGDAAGTQKQSFIQVAAATRPTLKRIRCTGDFGTGIIENGTAWVDAYLEDVVVDNASASPTVGILLQGTSSGQARNCHIRVASGTTYVTADNDMQWFECFGTGTDATAGEKIGTILAGDLEAKIDVIDGYFDAPTADATTDTTIRDAIGRKTDAAVTVVAATKTLMAYLKGAINWLTVGVADATSNASAADVVGNKTDASVYVPGTTKSVTAYTKGTADLQERVAISATAVLADATTIFTVAGGAIKIEALVSECVTTGDGGAATLQYSADPTVGAAGTISGATGSLATAVAGSTIILAGTALSTTPLFSVTGPNLLANPGTIIVPPGIITTVVGGAASTATWKHYLRYKPLQVGVTVS